jgi:hypothetical protein
VCLPYPSQASYVDIEHAVDLGRFQMALAAGVEEAKAFILHDAIARLTTGSAGSAA